MKKIFIFCLLSLCFFFISKQAIAIKTGTIQVNPPEVARGESITVTGSGFDPLRTLSLVVSGGSCTGFVCNPVRVTTKSDGTFEAISYSTWPNDKAGTIYSVKMQSGGADVSNIVTVTLKDSSSPSGSTLDVGADCTLYITVKDACPAATPCQADTVNPGSGRYFCGGVPAATPTPLPTPTPIALPSPPCKEGRLQPKLDGTGVIIGYKCLEFDTAIGGIQTEPAEFVKKIFSILLSLAGGIALLLIIYSGYQLIASQGNPEKVQGARETLTSTIVGLLFIIFALVILQVIGVDILKIPGFGS